MSARATESRRRYLPSSTLYVSIWSSHILSLFEHEISLMQHFGRVPGFNFIRMVRMRYVMHYIPT